MVFLLLYIRSVQRAIKDAERRERVRKIVRERERALAENAITFSLNISRESVGNVARGAGIESKNKNRAGEDVQRCLDSTLDCRANCLAFIIPIAYQYTHTLTQTHSTHAIC